MTSLVVTVRPFATPLVLRPGDIIPSYDPKQLIPGRLEWGAAGAVASAAQIDTGTGLKVESCSETYTEITSARVTEDVEIPDKNDPNNTVTVQRIKQTSFTKKLNSENTPKVEGFLNFGPDPFAAAFAEVNSEFAPAAFGPQDQGLQNNCKNTTIYNPAN